jgi:hypothetical protein
LKNNPHGGAQVYVWAAAAIVSLGWGFITALKPGHSQDLMIVNTWLRTWLWQGINPYYLPDTVVLVNYPPHAVVALSPLALLPESWMAAAWALLNLALAPAVGYLALRAPKPAAARREALLLCAMFLAWAGVRNGLATGQFTLLVLAFGLLASLYEEKRPWIGGFFLALALMKPHIGGAFLLWALLTKRWKMLLAACVVMCLGVALFSLRLGESPVGSVRAYLGVMQLQLSRAADPQRSMELRVVELRPLVSLFIQHDAWANRVHQFVLVVLLACVAAAAFLKSRLSRAERDAVVLQLCCLWLLMSAFHNPYDNILLLPVFAALWATARATHPSRSKEHQRTVLVWVLQLAMVVELPGLWWKLSQAARLSSFNWAGIFFSHFDRLLVLGLFIYLLNRVRLDWLAQRSSHGAGEMLAPASTTNS